MKVPDQLSLDFSSPDEGACAAPVSQVAGPVSAEVVQLDVARAAHRARKMAGVYDAIFASIKHINVRRQIDRTEEDSRFG